MTLLRAITPVLLALAAFLVAPATGYAQAEGFDVSLFRPLPEQQGDHEFVRSARTLPARALELGVHGGFASGVLRADGGNGRDRYDLIASRNTATLLVALGLTDWLQIALDAPLIVTQSGATDLGAPVSSLNFDAGLGPGDPRVGIDARLLPGADRDVALALAIDFFAPLGDADALQGEGLRVAPHLVLDARASGAVRLSIDLGYMLRDTAAFGAAEVDDTVLYGLAADIGLPGGVVFVVPEVAGGAMLQAQVLNVEELPLVGRLGVEARLEGGTTIGAGASTGLIRGVGTTDFTGTVHVTHALTPGGGGGTGAPRDRDGDGVPNDLDLCRTDAEDIDGFQDEDGCPDPDNDGDNFVDLIDACPDAAEDVDGFQDEDGCPEVDNDLDGIPDAMDRCPNESPETRNGYRDDDGCPDTPIAGLPLTCRLIAVDAPILFRSGRDTILEESYPVVDQVADVLLGNADILRVRVEGHTDSVGSSGANLEISQERADAVVRYLLERGVAPERLEAVGFGEEMPIADNESSDGRAANRRVVFTVLERVGCGE